MNSFEFDGMERLKEFSFLPFPLKLLLTRFFVHSLILAAFFVPFQFILFIYSQINRIRISAFIQITILNMPRADQVSFLI